MKVYGYDLGYTYSTEDEILSFIVKCRGETVDFNTVPTKIKREHAFDVYKDWADYMSRMNEYHFLSEIGQLKP